MLLMVTISVAISFGADNYFIVFQFESDFHFKFEDS
jgi:hypothetical protein